MNQPVQQAKDPFRPMTEAERLAEHQALLDGALTKNTGNRPWREWKALAAKEVFDLVNQTPRVRVRAVGLDGGVRVGAHLVGPALRRDGRTLRARDAGRADADEADEADEEGGEGASVKETPRITRESTAQSPEMMPDRCDA